MVDPFLPDDKKVAAIRELLPAVGAGIHLDVATAGPFPAETARALSEADDWELKIGRAGPDREADLRLRADEARAVLAAVMGGDPDDIVLAHGPGEALVAALRALDLAPDARLLVASQLEPELRAAIESSAPAASRTRTWSHRAQLDELVAEGPRGVVVMPMVSASTGERLPVRDVASDVRARGWAVVIEASDATGAIPIDAPSLGASAITFAGDRWLLGPEGTGALWLDRSRRSDPPFGPWPPWADPLPRRSVLGLARSVGWLAMYVGLPWAFERTLRLADVLVGELERIDGVELVTPATEHAAIAAFRIRGWSLEEAADELARRAFAIVGRVEANRALRASVGCWNTEEELRRFLYAVEELARYTPESIPRRPALTILRDGPS